MNNETYLFNYLRSGNENCLDEVIERSQRAVNQFTTFLNSNDFDGLVNFISIYFGNFFNKNKRVFYKILKLKFMFYILTSQNNNAMQLFIEDIQMMLRENFNESEETRMLLFFTNTLNKHLVLKKENFEAEKALLTGGIFTKMMLYIAEEIIENNEYPLKYETVLDFLYKENKNNKHIRNINLTNDHDLNNVSGIDDSENYSHFTYYDPNWHNVNLNNDYQLIKPNDVNNLNKTHFENLKNTQNLSIKNKHNNNNQSFSSNHFNLNQQRKASGADWKSNSDINKDKNQDKLFDQVNLENCALYDNLARKASHQKAEENIIKNTYNNNYNNELKNDLTNIKYQKNNYELQFSNYLNSNSSPNKNISNNYNNLNSKNLNSQDNNNIYSIKQTVTPKNHHDFSTNKSTYNNISNLDQLTINSSYKKPFFQVNKDNLNLNSKYNNNSKSVSAISNNTKNKKNDNSNNYRKYSTRDDKVSNCCSGSIISMTNTHTSNSNTFSKYIKSFKPSFDKKENIDKKIIRKFRIFLINSFKKKILNFNNPDKQYWNMFMKENCLPPFKYYSSETGEDIVFKSFSNNFLFWFFNRKDCKQYYEFFFEKEGKQFYESFLKSYNKLNSDEDQQKQLYNYLRNFHNIYSSASFDKKSMEVFSNLNLFTNNYLGKLYI